ncbi:MAG: glycosyltransferase family 9 protein, partial [Chitinivibrionia bacterium]|nr:glycosyltransferase family 9 protein [Chitinivibrionia bacterium]
YLAKPPAADLLAGEPCIANIHALSGDGFAETLKLVRALRRRRYALAVDLLANPRSALLTRLSGASVRVGGARRIRRHLYTHQVSVPPDIRAATGFHAHHLEAIGMEAAERKPSLTMAPEERAWADEFLASLGAQGGKNPAIRIGIHPGGPWEVKRWPAPYFARLARALRRKLGARIFVIAGPGEEQHVENLKAHLETDVVFVPLLPVRRAAALISRLDCMIVGDGGIMHVSVAVDTPTVGIFGGSEPDIWFPYERYGPYRAAVYPIECRPCHSHTCEHLSCLRELSVEKVEKLVFAAIEERSAARNHGRS